MSLTRRRCFLFGLASFLLLSLGMKDSHAEEKSELVKEIARCAEIENTIKRGECYDSLAAKLELQPKTEYSKSGGRWHQSVDRSEFDDSKSVYLRLDADEQVQISKYDEVRPTLWIRCHENTTALIVNVGHFLGSDRMSVEYRVDRAATRSDRWGISTDHNSTGLWEGATSIPFIRSLFGKDRLLLRLTPYSEGTSTISFTITGLKDSIDELASACHWVP